MPDVRKVEPLPYKGTKNGKVKVFYIIFHYRKFVYHVERVISRKLRRLLNGDSAS